MKTPTPLQCRDTALAVIFLLLLVWLFTRNVYLIYAAGAFTLYAIIAPNTLRPAARLWFGLSHVPGAVMSKVPLGLIFLVVVVPVSLVRRCMGKGSLRLRSWKKGAESAFVARDHTYTKEDLSNAF